MTMFFHYRFSAHSHGVDCIALDSELNEVASIGSDHYSRGSEDVDALHDVLVDMFGQDVALDTELPSAQPVEIVDESEVTSVRTMFNVAVHAKATTDGAAWCHVVSCNHRHEYVIECENFRIDSTLRPVFEFSHRYPEPRVGELWPYVPANLSMPAEHKLGSRTSPSGHDKDYTEFRCLPETDEVAWLTSELWEEMDSSAVAELGKYCVSLGKLNVFSREAVNGLSRCGWDIAPNGDIVNEYDGEVVAEFNSPHYGHVLVDANKSGSGSSYAYYRESGNNHAKLVRAAKGSL